MVINKPSGLAVHGGSGIHLGLVEALRQMSGEHSNYRELVHRLDRDTSGCVMVAKKRSMLRYLHELLRNDHAVKKTYLALVVGQWPTHKNVINVPLLKNELLSGERMVKVSDSGKASETHFSIERRYRDATLMRVIPVTGRTHQIRVHAQFAGHSIVGDAKYTDDEINKQFKSIGCSRLCLHAHSLTLSLPNGKQLNVEAPLPEDIGNGLNNLVPFNN